MTPFVARFPLDLLGTSTDNYVKSEPHQLVRQPMRSIIPKQGGFFAKGLRIYDPVAQRDLIKDEQYELHQFYPEASLRTAQAVWGCIVINDSDVSDLVEVSYQAIGGEYSNAMPVIEALLDSLKNDNRSTQWSNVSDLPSDWFAAKHKHDLGDGANFDTLTLSLERVLAAIKMRDIIGHDLMYKDIDNRMGTMISDGSQYANAAMAAHIAALNPHEQYVIRSEVEQYLEFVRRPTNVFPSAGQLSVPLDVTLQLNKYCSIYRILQASARFQVSSTPDFAAPEIDVLLNSPVATYHYPGILSPNTTYYWRGMYTDAEARESKWSAVSSFKTLAVSIGQPSITSPTNNAESGVENVKIFASAFTVAGATDTHASSDWEIWDGPNATGNRVFLSANNAVDKTSITVPYGTLERNKFYYVRVKYRSSQYGTSPWSAVSAFYSTWQLRPTVLGQLFGGGYWGGDLVLNDGIYAIVVAPKASGEATRQLQTVTTIQTGAYSDTDSAANTAAIQPRSPAAQFVRSLNIAGFTDWQVPAKAVLTVLQNKLLPSSASTPALFKTGGAEAFNAVTPYWTSTCVDWIRDDSYSTGGDPIYGWASYASPGYARWYASDGPENPDISCPNSSTVTSDVTNLQYFPGDFFSQWTWECVGQQYKVVGYTPVEDYEVYTPLWEVWAGTFNAAKTSAKLVKTLSRFVRAVRLVRVVDFAATPVGTAMEGGTFGGRVMIAGEAYGLIVSPKATGETVAAIRATAGSTVAGKTSYDGFANTTLLKNANNSPAANWAKALTIGGYTDWYLPSFYEMDILYRAFKPENGVNSLDQDSPNQYSIPVKTIYTTNDPPQTNVASFQSGGSEAFTANYYGVTSALTASCDRQLFAPNAAEAPGQPAGRTDTVANQNTLKWRAIRRYKL